VTYPIGKYRVHTHATHRERDRETERERERGGRGGNQFISLYIYVFVLFSSCETLIASTYFPPPGCVPWACIVFRCLQSFLQFVNQLPVSAAFETRSATNGTLSSRVSQCSVQRASPAVLSQQSFLVFIAAVPPVGASYLITRSNMSRSMLFPSLETS